MPTKIILSTEKLNDKGMIIYTEGIDLTEYKDNPILLYMHNRGEVIGKVTNLAIEEGAKGKQLVGWVEFANTSLGREKQALFAQGILKMFSIGIEIIECYKVDGITLVLKCKLKETSAVDIPSNTDCKTVEELQLKAGDMVTLSAAFTENIVETLKPSSMKKIAVYLGMADNVSEEDIIKVIDKLKQENSQAAEFKTKMADFETLKTDLAKTKEDLATAKATQLVELAFAARKITAPEREGFIKLATSDYDTCKSLLDSRKSYESLYSQIGQPPPTTSTDKDWDYYHKNNPSYLEKLKKENKPEYERLFNEKYPKE